jgi:hypothetical protein
MILFKGSEILYALGYVPALWIFGGFVFGLAAPICFLWTLKILIWGSAREREAPTMALEAPWWQKPE